MRAAEENDTDPFLNAEVLFSEWVESIGIATLRLGVAALPKLSDDLDMDDVNTGLYNVIYRLHADPISDNPTTQRKLKRLLATKLSVVHPFKGHARIVSDPFKPCLCPFVNLPDWQGPKPQPRQANKSHEKGSSSCGGGRGGRGNKRSNRGRGSRGRGRA
ncbi:hypothetical protein GYMLUDRAFT_58477 [Collybiopsis luxurians FD-317 M1]|uniref:Uncharacterized protein n=1 Tax=Collybiopsis luxurians FD-317 M1 TaxID=944289 RepID=A0A0D0D048_9AGAR|nr:hypothetical protein GYMLUDRAFT_58477 [Collybiopsis luxurians FD-317 M1]